MSANRLPTRDKNGLPLCSTSDCPQYDGKRCMEMGFRPDRFCEPQLIDDRDAVRAERDEAREDGRREALVACADFDHIVAGWAAKRFGIKLQEDD